MAWNPVLVVNLILCIIILALGIWGCTKKKDDVPLYIGIGFGLFGVSHVLTLLGLAASLTALLVAIRLVAYLLVVLALYRVLAKR